MRTATDEYTTIAGNTHLCALPHRRYALRYLILILACVAAFCRTATAQEHDHIAIWSTEDGGGELTLDWEFEEKKVQLFESFCAGGECLYTTISPALLAPTVDEDSDDGLYVLKDATRLSVELVAIDAALVLNVNGNRLNAPGEAARLGTTPDLHVHPSWQLTAPEDEYGDRELSFKVTAESGYQESAVYTVQITNVPPVLPPTATPTVTPTPRIGACVGDCDHSGSVTVNELVHGVNMALADEGVDECPPFDKNDDDRVTIEELVGAVQALINGCGEEPTPTRPPVSFAKIQEDIFTPSCALPDCHNAQTAAGNLVLAAGSAYAELYRVGPDIFAARTAGLLRVDPGNPDNSLLLAKLTGPRPDFGSRMPLAPRPPLSDDLIQLIRDWIEQGAPE